MTEQEHSPLPWRNDGWGGIVDADGKTVRIYSFRNETPENRDLIIRAVNAHDALVKALKKILPYGYSAAYSDDAVAAAHKALKLAGEEDD